MLNFTLVVQPQWKWNEGEKYYASSMMDEIDTSREPSTHEVYNE